MQSLLYSSHKCFSAFLIIAFRNQGALNVAFLSEHLMSLPVSPSAYNYFFLASSSSSFEAKLKLYHLLHFFLARRRGGKKKKKEKKILFLFLIPPQSNGHNYFWPALALCFSVKFLFWIILDFQETWQDSTEGSHTPQIISSINILHQ